MSDRTNGLARVPEAHVTRHEEELALERAVHRSGGVRAHKVVDHEHVTDTVPRDFERAQVERVPVQVEDSGEIETLADGSVSIPVFDEELVITKRRIVRERIVIRKSVTTERVPVEADLRKERVEVRDAGVVEEAPQNKQEP